MTLNYNNISLPCTLPAPFMTMERHSGISVRSGVGSVAMAVEAGSVDVSLADKYFNKQVLLTVALCALRGQW